MNKYEHNPCVLAWRTAFQNNEGLVYFFSAFQLFFCPLTLCKQSFPQQSDQSGDYSWLTPASLGCSLCVSYLVCKIIRVHLPAAAAKNQTLLKQNCRKLSPLIKPLAKKTPQNKTKQKNDRMRKNEGGGRSGTCVHYWRWSLNITTQCGLCFRLEVKRVRWTWKAMLLLLCFSGTWNSSCWASSELSCSPISSPLFQFHTHQTQTGRALNEPFQVLRCIRLLK